MVDLVGIDVHIVNFNIIIFWNIKWNKSSLTWLIGVRLTNIVLNMICYCMLDISVSILVVLSLVKTRAFETFHSTISSNNIIEFDGAAVADYLGLPELWTWDPIHCRNRLQHGLWNTNQSNGTPSVKDKIKVRGTERYFEYHYFEYHLQNMASKTDTGQFYLVLFV